MATQESTQRLHKQNDVPSTATVTVASKLPFDLIMRLYDFVERHEPVMGGGTRAYRISEHRRGSKTFVAQGNSWPQNKGPHQELSFGFAITRDIPKAFWDEWVEQNKEADYVVNKMIFAHGDAGSTKSQAREMEEERSGLERLDPKKLPGRVQQSDDMKRAS